jgi:acetolactate synthase-1/2/3 large subunit
LERAFARGGPCVVDCVIDFRDRVFPIIPPGATADGMLFTEDMIEGIR